jgi:hypothetical protein
MRAICGSCCVLCNQLVEPYGLRFTADGTGLAVANGLCVSLFCTENGSFVRHLSTALDGAIEVEECEGGWLVACVDCTTGIEFVSSEGTSADGGGADRPRLDSLRRDNGDTDLMSPSALALVPGLGLVVREERRLQFFASPDYIAMASMSPNRVAWMAGVARCAGARARAVTAKASSKAGSAGRSKGTRRSDPAAGR